jgi:hypothetical protein
MKIPKRKLPVTYDSATFESVYANNAVVTRYPKTLPEDWTFARPRIEGSNLGNTMVLGSSATLP